MKYLNIEKLNAIDAHAFQHQHPYPWVNPHGVLTTEGWEALMNSLPDVNTFEGSFGKDRKHGQYSHDRYVLEYQDGINIPKPWQEFIDELKGETYRQFVYRLMGRSGIRLRFHWHYTPNGCSVSPHCDSKTKLGSHIFYLNREHDWDPAWGGATVILNDHGRFETGSSPSFEDFDEAFPADTSDNSSLIFGRKGNSWHGVKEITCPDDQLRRVFIIIFEDAALHRVAYKRVKRLLQGKPLITDKERAMY